MAASRLQRWAVFLSAYDFEIEFVRSNNNVADALSRLIRAHKSEVEKEFDKEVPEQTYLHFASEALLLDYKVVKMKTLKDRILGRVLRYIRDGWPAEADDKGLSPYFSRKSELYCELGCVMWGHRVVIPLACRDCVLKELHEPHMGIVKTKQMARSYAWWPGIDEAIEMTCRSCEVCASVADAPPAHVPRSWPWPERPWSRLHMDFLGPMSGVTYLIVIDAYSKWLEIERMSSTTAGSVIGYLRSLWARFGLPKTVVSDNGPPFSSGEVKDFLARNGIEQIFSAPYHPASNGAAENAVRTCKRVIRKAICQKLDIQLALNRFLLSYRNTEHSTTGVSPAMLLQGRSLRTRLDALKPDIDARVQTAQQRQVKASGGAIRNFVEGDLVWFRRKAGDLWLGGSVVKRLGDRDYLIKDLNGTEVHRHVDQVRRRLVASGTYKAPSAHPFISSSAESTSVTTPTACSGVSSESSEEISDQVQETNTPCEPAVSERRYPSRERRPPTRYMNFNH